MRRGGEGLIPCVSLHAVHRAYPERDEGTVLAVPSAILPKENLYLNPEYPGFSAIVVGPPEPFHLDRRLLG